MAALVPGANLLLHPEAFQPIQHQLDTMSKISGTMRGELNSPQSPAALSNVLNPAEGAALRGLQQLLNELDPSQQWGNLRRVTNQSRDILWVCPQHVSYYDQGLPNLS